MCVVRRVIGAQVYSVVRRLFGCGLVGLLVVLIVPLFLSFLAMPGLCCFLRVTPAAEQLSTMHDTSIHPSMQLQVQGPACRFMNTHENRQHASLPNAGFADVIRS